MTESKRQSVHRRVGRLFLCACLWLIGLPAFADENTFGFSRDGSRIVVKTGADLVFSIDTRNGDLVSMQFRGDELQTTERKGSQLASGLGTAQVDVETRGDSIVVSARSGDLIQYYIARKGRDAIYLATYAPTLPPAGELRFVTRLNVSRLPKADHGTDSNVGQVIEGKDVFLLPDGRTSSKFYSARPAKDDALHGVHGPGVAVYMLMGNRELSSGGPLFKDIATQKTAVTHELYSYMYSNHTQTEPYRGGLHGVYGLLFTDGGPPSDALMNLRFVDDSLGLKGFLSNAGRGAVTGHIAGVAAGMPAVVGLSNGSAQYWASVGDDQNFKLNGIIPGHYRTVLYQKELEVARGTVDVTANATARVVLEAQPLPGQVMWQIGAPDGTPVGFRNADLLASEHPSDSRMAPWSSGTYIVGASAPSDLPAAQWRDVNTPTRIEFVLGPNALHDYRLRLFVTLSQAGARPTISVNHVWDAPVPPPPDQPDSRGITRGTYRGNNTLYETTVPGTALHAGANVIEIGVASGKAGTGFLSPGFVFDSVQWVAP
ncbi:polysaccharide lyase family protein [Pseudomonas sp. KU26590]|uniref:rhamnogalacturonan lyase B N-terminal domain-containing protein n=1 Tax=Pseudomonas sp. KU26590 TaxID=2991051 RepID=UPI00223CB858|nr:rhamnogalacturonan lyase B N-terminal domain-containing protein [Pseudomonas sp. KU26590]UZJ57765.1 polysaccharide lyase family protein [Pseudomonas sp. KU26590]